MGAPLIVKTVEGIVNGSLNPKPQDHSKATFAPVLKKEDGVLNWSKSALEIHNRVRAFNPWPGTVTKFRDQVCKVLKTRLLREGEGQASAGVIVSTKGQLWVMCGDGNPIEIVSIQPANRKSITGADFANGLRVQRDEKFQTVMDN
jgi:methionyl-tRNA formyltransferase